ncbi:MAG: calcium-translocating P-type ATPase, PMCA-type [Erysipelotrichaceae bacterium]|nr:calcium-translocating P-type ATPase, PMCA-type [Erysipelotrichaceae bacterium]
MSYYLKSKEEVLKEVESSPEGLTTQQANERVEKYGKNKLEEPPKKTFIQKFFSSLVDPMIIMLLVAATISTFTTIYQNVVNNANESYADLFIILFVVVVNTILSVIQEDKAEEAIGALKEMTAATSKVLRDGKQVIVKSEDLTIGDVLVFEAGDAIPADCRILESYSMKVEEAALTGESVPVNKLVDVLMLKDNSLDIPLGDRRNMLYSGSTIAYGRGKAVVVAIGMDTEMGKIASALSQQEDEKTPLQKKMSELSVTLTKIVIAVCVIVFVFGVARDLIFSNNGDIFGTVLNTFIIAVALAVAAIPEGLPAVVTVILSIGVTAMSKRNALIRKLTAVETLGCTQIICSDKTGTLTQNKMTVVDTFTNDVHLLATGMALCSDAKIDPEKKQAVGEPTEAALVNFAYKHDLPSYTLIEQQPRVGEAPFDSMRKMMSTVHKYKEGYIQYTKGANEIVLSHCNYYLDENHQVVKLTEEVKTEITHKAKEYADRALRVLGLGYRLYDEKPANFDSENLENDLIYVGFTGMIDPCRDEVYDAIKECESAGIRPVMITGDHIDTAVAIGKDLGIITDASQAMLGSQLDSLTDEQLKEVVQKTSVFARVQPEHKTRIVRAFKDLGNVVAMTGDGVNDAPSIKAADIGVGMGITGTDVTKSVADMVLADDNFATIVNAVEEGRKINDNVRKVLQFQISSNMTEVLVVFISSIFALEVLSPTHLLWINMVTDSLPGLALGMEKAEEGVMKRKPRPSNESVFSNGAGLDIVLQGIYMSTIILTSFFIGYKMDGHLNGMTMAFLTINLAELFHAISMRTQRGSLIKLKTFNWWLFGALTLTFLLNIALIYVPAFEVLFDFAPINFTEFMIALALAFSVLPVLEVYKFIMRTIDKNKNK